MIRSLYMSFDWLIIDWLINPLIQFTHSFILFLLFRASVIDILVIYNLEMNAVIVTKYTICSVLFVFVWLFVSEVSASQFIGWDHFGIAKFDLSDLLLGQTMLQLRSPILNCPLPENYIAPPVSYDGRLVIPPGTTQGPGMIIRSGYIIYMLSFK